MIRGHGGNIHEAAKAAGCRPEEIVDMSSNVNPLGPPPGLDEFLCDRIETVHALPEADAAHCCSLFARRQDLDPQWVIAANGTTHFIHALPRALAARRALILAPTYADYADACISAGVDIDWMPLAADNGFAPDPERLDRRLSAVDTAFVCNPNNPTGVLLPAKELARLCRAHPKVRFVVDESYLPFLARSRKESMVDFGLPNVLVLNSLSKVFRIPGLRIGFMIAPPDLLAPMRRCQLPWSVGSLAQAAVEFLMTRAGPIEDFLEETRRHVAAETRRFSEQMERCPGIRVFPSCTIFSLLRLPATLTAPQAVSRLLKHRILVRDCANFQGLSERYIRVSLKRAGQNDLLVDLLRTEAAAARRDPANESPRAGRK